MDKNNESALIVAVYRVYDVLMTILAGQNPDAHERLYQLHREGKTLSPPPLLSEWVGEAGEPTEE